MADPVAFGNLAVELLSPGENLCQRAFAQQIAADFAQRFARIENVAIRVDARKHRGKALEVAEAQKRFDGARRPVDRLDVLHAPLDDFSDQFEIARIFDQSQIGHFFVQRALRCEHKPLFACPVQNAFDLADIPFFDHRADGDRSGIGHARFGQRDILHHLRQRRGLRQWIRRIHGERVQADHQAREIFEKGQPAVQQAFRW